MELVYNQAEGGVALDIVMEKLKDMQDKQQIKTCLLKKMP